MHVAAILVIAKGVARTRLLDSIFCLSRTFATMTTLEPASALRAAVEQQLRGVALRLYGGERALGCNVVEVQAWTADFWSAQGCARGVLWRH